MAKINIKDFLNRANTYLGLLFLLTILIRISIYYIYGIRPCRIVCNPPWDVSYPEIEDYNNFPETEDYYSYCTEKNYFDHIMSKYE
jgi:hypothetical protein